MKLIEIKSVVIETDIEEGIDLKRSFLLQRFFITLRQLINESPIIKIFIFMFEKTSCVMKMVEMYSNLNYFVFPERDNKNLRNI